MRRFRDLPSWFALGALLIVAGSGASAQVVAGWGRESVSGVEFAFFSGRGAELTVRCRGNAVEVVYYIDSAALDPALRNRATAVMAVLVDDSPEYVWKTSRLISEAGVASVGIGGEDANALAHDLGNAARRIVVGILTGPPQLGSVPYNTTEFPIYGAADAIKSAYAGCGIKY
jgi:hypothetical protein